MIHFKVKCPGCGKPVTDIQFGTDELTRKEFMISGLCKKCQDKVFTNENDTLII